MEGKRASIDGRLTSTTSSLCWPDRHDIGLPRRDKGQRAIALNRVEPGAPPARSLRSCLGRFGGERASALLGQAGNCIAHEDNRHISQHGGLGTAATEAGGQDERDPDPGPG
jgi:hypothetical protein